MSEVESTRLPIVNPNLKQLSCFVGDFRVLSRGKRELRSVRGLRSQDWLAVCHPALRKIPKAAQIEFMLMPADNGTHVLHVPRVSSRIHSKYWGKINCRNMHREELHIWRSYDMTTNWTSGNNYKRNWTEPAYMVRPCSENGRRKITQNSIAVDAETKESTRKTEEKLDGRYKEGHERKKPKWRPVGR